MHVPTSRGFAGRLVGVALALASSAGAAQESPLTLASFGGSYAQSQVVAFTDPFARTTGRWVEMVDYGGDLATLRGQVGSGQITWDVVDMRGEDAIRACDEGLLEPLGALSLPPGVDGTPADQDFLPGMLLPCAVGQNVWATVIAFDRSAFPPEQQPVSLQDFFDTERFPGSRALRKEARVNLEWALLADGVEPSEVYTELATEAGTRRALAVLDGIRDQIIWWENGETPIDMLVARRVAMASAWNGRVYARAARPDIDLAVIWDGHVLAREFWTVPRGAPNRELAFEFIRFAVDPARQARQAAEIAYSPARASAQALVPASVRPFLPTSPQNAARRMTSDVAWWAEHGARLEAAFVAWVDGKDPLEALRQEAFTSPN